MSKDIDDLTASMQPLALTLIDSCAAAGMPVAVICTLRDLAAEQEAVATGHSWLTNPEHGMHLAHPPDGKARAIDICPVAYLSMPGWHPKGPFWDKMGAIGKGLGLKWGGDWVHVNGGRGDPSHFELPQEPSASHPAGQPLSQS